MQADQRTLVAVGLIESLVRQAEEQGIHIEMGNRFYQFARICRGLDRGQCMHVFDPARSDVDSTSAFWIVGRSPSGEVVHTQALRAWDLSGSSLRQHLLDHGNLYGDPKLGLDPERSQVIRDAENYTGRAVYHGEVWIHRSYRGRRLAEILPKLGLTLAWLIERPRFVWGMALGDVPRRGLCVQYGYTSAVPRAVTWRGSDGRILLHEWLVVARESELFTMIDDEAERLGVELKIAV